jgi:ATP-binding cassette subfamily B protein
VALVALLGGSGINLLFPVIVRYFIEELSSQQEVRWLIILIVFGGLFFLQAVCFYFRSLLFGLIGNRIALDLRVQAFRNLINRPITFFDLHNPSELISRLTSDVQMIQTSLSMALSVFLRYFLQVVGGGILMVWLSPTLSFLLVIAIPMLVLVSIFFVRKLKNCTKKQQEALGISAQVAEELLGGMDVVKAYGLEERQSLRYTQLASNVCARGIERVYVSAFFQSVVSLLLHLVLVGIFLYAIYLVKIEVVTVALLTEFFMYGTIVAVSFALLSNSISDLSQAVAALERVQEFLNEDQDRDFVGHVQNMTLPIAVSSSVLELRNVYFTFPGRSDIEVLTDVSLKVEPGKVTALVGKSGSGKSAIVNLLLGFYRPQKGDVFIGGKSYGEISLSQLRARVGYVSQSPALFGLSIRDNLLLSAPEATDEELWKFIELVRLKDFIKSLPQQLDTVLGAKGAQLSGGQKQRLAIARALLRNPELVILDEATSNLDTENEREILERVLDEELRDSPYTVVFVTHKLSSLKYADKVYVVDNGKVLEEPLKE